jgi:hypothetical protein
MEDLLAGLEAHLIGKGCSKENIAKTGEGLEVSHKKGLISLTRMSLCKEESYAVILYFKSSNPKDYGEDLRKHSAAHAAVLKTITGPDPFTAIIRSKTDFDRIDLMLDVIEKYVKLYEEAYTAPAKPSIPHHEHSY